MTQTSMDHAGDPELSFPRERQAPAHGARQTWLVLSRPPSGGRQTACPSPRGCDAPAGPLLSGRPSARGQALTTSPAFRSLRHKAGAQCSEPAAAQTHCSRPPRRPGADCWTAPPTDSPSCCPPPDLTSVSVSGFPVWGGPERPALPPQGLWAATAAGRLLSALLRASEQVLRRSVFSGPPDTRCFPPLLLLQGHRSPSHRRGLPATNRGTP